MTIPLGRCGDMFCVRVDVEGRESGWFLVDTGGPISTIDAGLVTRADLPLRTALGERVPNDGTRRPGIGPNALFASFRRLGIGDATAGPGVGVVRDLTAASAAVGIPLLGIVGNDLLAEQPFTLDFRAATLTLYDPSSFKPPQGDGVSEYPLDWTMGFLATPGRVEGHEGWFMIDTGSNLELILHRPFLKIMRGLKRTSTTQFTAGITGREEQREARFDSLEMFGRTWRGVFADYYPTDTSGPNPGMGFLYAGMVGMMQMAEGRFTFDRAGRKMWVQWPAEESAEEVIRRLGGPGTPDLAGSTPMIWAAKLGRRDVAEALIAQNVDVNAKAPLTFAVVANRTAVVQVLLENGAAPDVTSGEDQWTPLLFAARFGNVEICKLLLKHGAAVDGRDASGATPLMRAAEAGHVEVVKLLLASGADAKAKSNKAATPLIFGAGAAERAVIELLLAAGADPRSHNDLDWTPILTAAIFNRVENARLLLEHGAVVDEADNSGRTALMLAAQLSNVDMVQFLLEHGADPSLKTKDGKTAKDFALATSARAFRDMILHELESANNGDAKRPRRQN